jgi:phage terminase small subunit
VAELVEAPKAELMEKSQMTLEKWVKLVTALAFYDPRKLLDKFGNPIEIPELDELHAMAVEGYEHVEEFEGRGEARLQTGWTRKVKLLDQTPYVRMLGKYLNAFPITKQPIMLPPQTNPR